MEPIALIHAVSIANGLETHAMIPTDVLVEIPATELEFALEITSVHLPVNVIQLLATQPLELVTTTTYLMELDAETYPTICAINDA
jgi:hypothetical protein